MQHTNHIGSCGSCGIHDCHLNVEQRYAGYSTERTAFLLDEVWPEYRAYIATQACAHDLFIGTINGQLWRKSNYDWFLQKFGDSRFITHLGLWRSLSSRKLAHKSGAHRQKNSLIFDQRIAKAMTQKLPYEVSRLFATQNLLPFLYRQGALGGRQYSVLMYRYPLKILQAKLDQAKQTYPESGTLADFRADQSLVEAEWQAIADAEKIITCHAYIATLFPERSLLLPWEIPSLSRTEPAGTRSAFMGPTIGRKGAYAMREVARTFTKPLVIFGRNLEAVNFWDGVPIEQRNWSHESLRDIGTLFHPAIIENNPRRLLFAYSQGIRIIATKECGLPSSMYTDFYEYART